MISVVFSFPIYAYAYFRPQRPRSFWSAPRIARSRPLWTRMDMVIARMDTPKYGETLRDT